MSKKTSAPNAGRFEAAVERYFNGICRTSILTETVALTGEGKKELHSRVPVLNDNGDPVVETQWFKPPSMTDLCLHLGLTEQRLAELEAGDDAVAGVAARARARVESYLQQQLESAKRVSGVAFKLTHLFGWKNRQPAGAESAAGSSVPLSEKMRLVGQLGEDTADEDAPFFE